MSDERLAQLPSTPSTWHQMLIDVFKGNDVRLATYVPDTVLTPLIDAVHAEPLFTAFVATREEEAVGAACGAWMGGSLSVAMMQTSGFGTLGNALASLVVPYQIPLIMVISERGTLGEFNLGQTMVWRTMRPLLDTLGIEHHTITRLDEMSFIADRSIKQAVATRVPIALILSPLLTGGKAVKQKGASS
jgi:sulfopyruvate decarboxylase TPP-binding subunit